ncbi:hypothetical protein AMTR_s00010p00171570 [Amborella trichopoda]|uniref:Uncharacterized protein n=1 Tax=Amborella trichopoda TaxID=13333 RepID=W1NFC6_AMBTC|nr:hypothetical protein AMTR_s00010p00171570 [Amborella trichopoda]
MPSRLATGCAGLGPGSHKACRGPSQPRGPAPLGLGQGMPKRPLGELSRHYGDQDQGSLAPSWQWEE